MSNTVNGLNGFTYTGALGPIAAGVAAFQRPGIPSVPTDIFVNVPAAPADVVVGAVTPFDIATAPEFTAVAPPVDFSFAPPTPLTSTVPTSPALNGVTIPNAPLLVLPDAPNLLGIDVPVTPLLTLPIFSIITPDSPLAPANTFSFTEPTFASSLLDALRAKLLDWVNGVSTGLDPVVEQAIWDRGRSRENMTAGRKIKEAIRTFAARGFSKPPGALSTEIQSALQDTQDTLSTQSREVAINQANLEQSNRRFAMEEAWKIDEGFLAYHNQKSQRMYEAAKYVQQIAIDIYHEQVGAFVAEVQAYAAEVEAFKATIQAELSKLEIYKAQLEGQRLIGQINIQATEVYKARIDAARILIDVFRTQVEAANVQATVNKTQIESFAAQVNAYGETVRAKAAEYDSYATRVRAEVAKVDVFKTQAEAYTATIGGYRAGVDAKVAAKNIEIELAQRLPLEVSKNRADIYRTKVAAEAERSGAVVKAFEGQVQLFAAQEQGEAGRVSAEANVYKAAVDYAIGYGTVGVETAKAAAQIALQKGGIIISAVQGGASVAGHVAASAMSSVNVGAQLGAHSSTQSSNTSSTVAHNSSSNSSSRSTSGVISDITTHKGD
jgi:hypothetical protein